MKSERIWIVVLSGTWLLVGFAAGVLVSLDRNPLRTKGKFSAFQERFVEAYDLDQRGRDRLADVLAYYDEAIERLKTRQLAELDEELVKVGEECMNRIHDDIVPEERREEFRLLAYGPFVPGAPAQ